MPTDFSSDKLQDYNEPDRNHKTWNGMAECVSKRPGILALGKWIDDSLDNLEKEFAEFSTQKSMRRNFGR